MPARSDTAERKIAALAGRANGVVTRVELLEAGVTRSEIEQRLANGLLIRVYPGVYRVGHCAPSPEADYTAAVKACGDGAALSGRAAAWLLGLVRGRTPEPEVTSPRRCAVSGLRVRCTRQLDSRDLTTCRGVDVTTVPRTLVDLARVLSPAGLARACHEAGVRYGTTPSAVEEVLARRPNSPGAAKLRRVLRGDERVTLSRLEARFLELVAEANLPLPETNRPAGGRRVDCRWPQVPLTVELDGYRYHGSRHAWEQDRRREREARARGDEFRRYTYGDVFEHPHLMMAELRALLA